MSQSTPVIQYKGPSLSVAAIQVFKEDVYVCYNGSELRRFNLKVIYNSNTSHLYTQFLKKQRCNVWHFANFGFETIWLIAKDDLMITTGLTKVTNTCKLI